MSHGPWIARILARQRRIELLADILAFVGLVIAVIVFVVAVLA